MLMDHCAVEVGRALDGDGPVFNIIINCCCFSTRIGVQIRGTTESNGTSKHKDKR